MIKQRPWIFILSLIIVAALSACNDESGSVVGGGLTGDSNGTAGDAEDLSNDTVSSDTANIHHEDSSDTTAADTGPTSCEEQHCDTGYHCIEGNEGPQCIENTCEDIESCPEGQVCEEPEDAPAFCRDQNCEDIESCPEGQVCEEPEDAPAFCRDQNCEDIESCPEGQVCEDPEDAPAFCRDQICEDIEPCPEGQVCEDPEDAPAFCRDQTCEDIECDLSHQSCEDPEDAPAFCRDLDCETDLDCRDEEFCNDSGLCAPDECTPGDSWCDGQDVYQCRFNGSIEYIATCDSATTFTSVCAMVNDQAMCSCADDWDCPTYMTCEAGVCLGTGREPMCTLPATPFQSVPPSHEIFWGCTSRSDQIVHGSPYQESGQVLSTPVVANLDDDNGDGLINEMDFPEIIFMTYRNNELRTNGVVRAIHGGGPNKGLDYFAHCSLDSSYPTWHEGEEIDAVPSLCQNTGANAEGGLAVGDINGDGIPEIVFPTEDGHDGIRILDNHGDPILTTPPDVILRGSAPVVSIANLDNEGFAEVIVGTDVLTFQEDADGNIALKDIFHAHSGYPSGIGGCCQIGPISCVADVTGDERLEIIAGSAAFVLPRPPQGATSQADCVNNGGSIMPSTTEEEDFCSGHLTLVWDIYTDEDHPENEVLESSHRDGYCAVADVLGVDPTLPPGPDNPLDGQPEVIFIGNGYLGVITNDGVLRRYINMQGGDSGGSPNIDDFDGDGFPEVAIALADFYTVYDFQEPTTLCPAWTLTLNDDDPTNPNPPRNPGGTCTDDSQCAPEAFCMIPTGLTEGQCTCYHNSWRQNTEDDSSRSTSSSVFDFNGDGRAEVVYNDECYLRIYSGLDGQVLFKEASLTRTAAENAFVADVDNDGNAEIVSPKNNQYKQCSEDIDEGCGIGVWGDPTDTWVSARRIYNEHTYHVTNVYEDAGIPEQEPHSWIPLNGRIYNTYRSQPRNGLVAPDLEAKALQIFSPDLGCGQLGDQIEIALKVVNSGDLRVGPGVVVSFYGTWNGIEEALLDQDGNPLNYVLTNSLEPGASVIFSLPYDRAYNNHGTLPDSIRASIDADDIERECIETNNDLSSPVESGTAMADLDLSLESIEIDCPLNVTVRTLVENSGNVTAENVVLRYYAGNPAQGGTILHEEVLNDPIPGGTSVSVEVNFMPPLNQAITLYIVVDPENLVEECNDANNQVVAEEIIQCEIN